MIRKQLLLTLFALLMLVGRIPMAAANLVIDINHPTPQPMPIAITDFAGGTDQERQIGHTFAAIVSADLESSGLFKPIDPKAFIQTPDSLQVGVRFADWKAINAQALVQGAIKLQPDGNVRLEFRLWDVFAENQMIGLAFNSTANNRRLGHKVADAVYKQLTGEEGYFDTQIVYV